MHQNYCSHRKQQRIIYYCRSGYCGRTFVLIFKLFKFFLVVFFFTSTVYWWIKMINVWRVIMKHLQSAQIWLVCNKAITRFYLPHTHRHNCIYSPAAKRNRSLAGTHCIATKSRPGWVDLGGWLHKEMNLRRLRPSDIGCQYSRSIYTARFIVATLSCRGHVDELATLLLHASMEQAADGAETAAIDGLVSSWSENISVSFCLRSPGCGLTLWCALDLLVGDAIQVPQAQLLLLLLELNPDTVNHPSTDRARRSLTS